MKYILTTYVDKYKKINPERLASLSVSNSSNAVVDIYIALVNCRDRHMYARVSSTGLKSNPQHFEPIKCSHRCHRKLSLHPSTSFRIANYDKLSNSTISFRFQTMHILKTCLWDHKVCDTDWRQYIITLNLLVIHL